MEWELTAMAMTIESSPSRIRVESKQIETNRRKENGSSSVWSVLLVRWTGPSCVRLCVGSGVTALRLTRQKQARCCSCSSRSSRTTAPRRCGRVALWRRQTPETRRRSAPVRDAHRAVDTRQTQATLRTARHARTRAPRHCRSSCPAGRLPTPEKNSNAVAPCSNVVMRFDKRCWAPAAAFAAAVEPRVLSVASASACARTRPNARARSLQKKARKQTAVCVETCARSARRATLLDGRRGGLRLGVGDADAVAGGRVERRWQRRRRARGARRRRRRVVLLLAACVKRLRAAISASRKELPQRCGADGGQSGARSSAPARARVRASARKNRRVSGERAARTASLSASERQ